MTAFSVLRFRVRPDREQEFLDRQKTVEANWPGLIHADIVKTGSRTFCMISQWDGMESLAKARHLINALLDSFVDMLEDLGGGVRITDPVSGPVVLSLK